MENSSSQKGLWVIVIAVVLVVIVGIVWHAVGPSMQNATATTSAPAATQNIQALFTCDSGKSINATFMNGSTTPPTTAGGPPTPGGSVMLVLSDGRQMTLPQTISADGARYANADESFVFWNKGNGAFVQENGTTTYNNCLTQTQ